MSETTRDIQIMIGKYFRFNISIQFQLYAMQHWQTIQHTMRGKLGFQFIIPKLELVTAAEQYFLVKTQIKLNS